MFHCTEVDDEHLLVLISVVKHFFLVPKSFSFQTILCGLIGIPPSNGVIPQSPMHTKTLATLKHQVSTSTTIRGVLYGSLSLPPMLWPVILRILPKETSRGENLIECWEPAHISWCTQHSLLLSFISNLYNTSCCAAVASQPTSNNSKEMYEEKLKLGASVWKHARSISTDADPTSLPGTLS